MTLETMWQLKLGEIAREMVDVYEIITRVSVELGGAGAPMKHVEEATALAKRALNLAAAVDELRNTAAPTNGRHE